MPQRGYQQTEEHRKNLSESHKGKKKSKEWRIRMSGDNNPSKRLEVREKISKELKGRKFSEEWKKKLSESKIGNKYCLGHKQTEEHRRRLSEAKEEQIPWNKGRSYPQFEGKSNPNWRGGKSFEPYTLEWTKILRLAIRQRDNFTCQKCGITEEEQLKEIGRILSVNHIDFDKTNCDPKNLNTLCCSCNGVVNYNREYWTNYFQKQLKINENV